MTAIRLLPDRKCDGCRRQAEWGCTAERWRWPDEGEVDGPQNWVNPAHLPSTLGDEESYACPRQHIRENPQLWALILKYYGMFRKGFLPNVGAIADQSNKAIEVFRILDDANDACDAEEARRAKEKQNRDHRAAAQRRQGR